MKIAFMGDVMLGRLVNEVLKHEPPEYPWGDTLSVLKSAARGGRFWLMKKYWSNEVTKKSNALDLEKGVFTWKGPRKIAESLKRSAERSARRKAKHFQSAMSMLNFYINRAGRNLDSKQKQTLEQAKDELRRLFKHE